MFDKVVSQAQAASNFIAIVYGGYKTGKTHFWNQSIRPLYVVYLDTNPNLETHLIKSSENFGDEVYKLVLRPVPYEQLTPKLCEEYLDKIQAFADWAKAHAAEEVAKGNPGGTFVVDGATYLKGYLEKFYLGESATLGYRPKQGERSGISTYDYVKPNGALFEFIAGFTGQKLDCVLVFEGRPVWRKVVNSKGQEESQRTDAWRSTRPDRVPFAVNVEVETMKVLERLNPADNKSPTVSKMKVRVLFNSENPAFDHMVLDGEGMGFQRLKEILLSEAVGYDALEKAKHISEVVRANTSGLLIEEGGEDADA